MRIKEIITESRMVVEDAEQALGTVGAQIRANKPVNRLTITAGFDEDMSRNKLATFLTTLYLLSSKKSDPQIATLLSAMNTDRNDLSFSALVNYATEIKGYDDVIAKILNGIDRYMDGDSSILLAFIEKLKLNVRIAAQSQSGKLA